MENITIKDVSVNHFSVEEWKEISFYTEGAMKGVYKNPTEAVILPSGQVYLLPPDFNVKSKNCPFNVPQTESKNDFIPKVKKRIPVQERYKIPRAFFRTGKIQNWAVLQTYDIIQSRKAIISLHRTDNVYFNYLLAFKGGAVYNHMLATKIKERAEEIVKYCNFRYFLTLTCDPAKYGYDRIIAWEQWIKEVSQFLRYMTRTFHVLYQAVVESTANGYPHIHIVIYSDHGLCGENKPKNCNKNIRRGNFVDWIKAHTPAPVFNLKHTTEGKIEYYLVKYITKVYNAKPDENKKRPDKIKGDEKKGMLTNILQVITGTRGYLANEQKTVDAYLEKAQKRDFTEKVITELKQKQETEVERILRENDNSPEALKEFTDYLRREAEYLINFRINSPETCGKVLIMVPNKYLRYVPKAERGKVVGKKPSFLDNPACKKICTCCKGCSLNDFREKTQDLRAEKNLFTDIKGYMTLDEFAQFNIDMYLEKKKEEKERKDEMRAKLGVKELFEEIQERIEYERAQKEYEERQGKVSYMPKYCIPDTTPDPVDLLY